VRCSHLLVVGTVLCGTVAGCGVRRDGSGDAGRGSRVLEVDTRLPGRATSDPIDAAQAEVAPSEGLTALARLDGSVAGAGGAADAVALVAADRVDPRQPSITLAFTGDTLVHSPLVRRALVYGDGSAFDFTPMFAAVAPVLGTADVAVCHLETPIAPPGEDLSTYPLYGVPPEVIGGLASAGYDRCSTASNHAMDRGLAGIDATVATLDAYGLGQSGMAATPDGAVPAILQAGGIALAHLSYSYGLNGLRFPSEEPWRTNLIDPHRIIVDAIDARARGAQVVIVSLHWGDEGSHRVSEYQRAVAEEITASGAIDLIVGHHAHVIQPIERINGTWVMFGLGNFLSNMPVEARWPAGTQDGVIMQVQIDQRPDGTIRIGTPIAYPTWVDKHDGYVIRPVLQTLADPTISDGLRSRLYESLLRTREVLVDFIPGM
jgi:hypothetical protein